MCFRPPSAGKPVKCPECGALNPQMAKNCIKCKADLTATKEEAKKEDKQSALPSPVSGQVNKPQMSAKARELTKLGKCRFNNLNG